MNDKYTIKFSILFFLLGLIVGFMVTSSIYHNQYKDYGGYFHEYNEPIRFEPKLGDSISFKIVECIGSNAVGKTGGQYVMLPVGNYYDNQVIYMYKPMVIGYTTYNDSSIPVLSK